MNNPTQLSKTYMLSAAMILISLISSVKTFAQSVPEKVEVDINTNGDAVWYGQPWIWAVGVAVFIIIIVAITRSGNRNNA